MHSHPVPASSAGPRAMPWRRRGLGRIARLAAPGIAALLLTGCAVGVGVGIPLAPGLSLSVGLGPGGPSIGLGTGWGPVGAGVALDGEGRVHGSAGVGVSAGHVGVGMGGSTVLYDPQAYPAQALPPLTPGVEAGVVVPGRAPERP